MKKYIKADLFRLFCRIPRWILIAIVLFCIGSIFWPDGKSDDTIIELIDILEAALKYVPIYIGFIEMIYVFGDDFTGKTAQIAIGTGIKRTEVILAKWIELLIIVSLDVIMIVVLALTFCFIQTRNIPAELITDIFSHMLVSIIATGAFMALVFPLMFFMQNITLAFLLYIMFASGVINKILGYVATLKWLRNFTIEKYTLSNLMNVFRSRMILGSFHIQSFIGIAIYIILALSITCMIYKKKELEF